MIEKIYHKTLEHYSIFIEKQIKCNESLDQYRHYTYDDGKKVYINYTDRVNVLVRIYWKLEQYDKLVLLEDAFRLNCNKDVLDDVKFVNYVIENNTSSIFKFPARIYRNLNTLALKIIISKLDSNYLLRKLPKDMLSNPQIIDLILDSIETQGKNIHCTALELLPESIYHDKCRTMRILHLNKFVFRKIPKTMIDDDIILASLFDVRYGNEHFELLPDNVKIDILNDGTVNTLYRRFELILYRKKLIAKMSRFNPDSHFRFH